MLSSAMAPGTLAPAILGRRVASTPSTSTLILLVPISQSAVFGRLSWAPGVAIKGKVFALVCGCLQFVHRDEHRASPQRCWGGQDGNRKCCYDRRGRS